MDPAARQLGTVERLGHERLGAEQFRRLDHGTFKRQVLECVEGIVVNEDADRPLNGEQVRRAIDNLTKPVARRKIAFGQNETLEM
jgi:hypothetical protein